MPLKDIWSTENQTPLSIGESTTFCEAAVPAYCVSTTCPQFCDTIKSPTAKRTCKTECTLDKRCKLKPAGGQDDPKNAALDAQNRDQLWACIAEDIVSLLCKPKVGHDS